MSPFITVCLILSSIVLEIRGGVLCTFSRSTGLINCDGIECHANTDNTPVGYYRMGAVEFNHNKLKNWVNLYPKQRSGLGYWDYYCENPDTGRSKIGLHAGSISLGCISIPNIACWNDLERLFTAQTPTSLIVDGVTRSGLGSFVSFSCSGGWAAGDPIRKTVHIIGSLRVIP